MEVTTVRRDLVLEGIELAKSRLRAGEEVAPMILLERAGDTTVQPFAQGALEAARVRFAELLRTASGGERYALVHLGYANRSDRAMVVELGRPGEGQPDVFTQRFRPHRGRFRRFKLIGDLEPAGKGALIV